MVSLSVFVARDADALRSVVRVNQLKDLGEWVRLLLLHAVPFLLSGAALFFEFI